MKRRDNAIERRLRQLEKERDLLRGDIKALSRVVKKPDSVHELPKLKSGRTPVPPEPRSAAMSDAAPAAVPSAQAPAGRQNGEQTFNWADGAPSRGMPQRTATAERDSGEPKNKAVLNDQRFANYFSSGGFVGGAGPQRPLKVERKVQRNKAIFLWIFVILAAFTVIRLIFQ